MDNLNIRIHASHIRTKLSKGYASTTASKPGSFLYILNRIPDATLVAMDREHATETAEHQAMLNIYRTRVSSKPSDSRAKIAASVELV